LAGHVALLPLSSVDAAAWPSVDTETITFVFDEGPAEGILIAICYPGLDAVALSDVVFPVSLVLGIVILFVDSCSVELIAHPLAIVVARPFLVVPSLLSITIPLIVSFNVLAAVRLLFSFELLFFKEIHNVVYALELRVRVALEV